MDKRWDAAVVGAGIAGLTAARLLAEAGKSVLLLEANERVGGRIFSAPSEDGAHCFELGAEFVHGKPSPTLELAREAQVELVPVADRHFWKHGSAFQELSDAWQPFEHVLKQRQSGEPDVSARVFLEQHAVDQVTGERFRQLVEGFEAAPLGEVSIESLAADAETMAQDEGQFRIVGGYGRLIEYLLEQSRAAGVELRLGSAVSHVGWQPNGPVSLALESRVVELEARLCVVAVPLGVLQASAADHGLSIEPAVPGWRAASAGLGMGHACRVCFEFRGQLGGAVPRDAFIHQPSSLFESFWSEQRGNRTIVTAWAGGPKAQELARETAEQRQRLALGALATLLDVPEAALADTLISSGHHDFSNDPRARGAYSFCRPGGVKATEALSVPCAGAVFLAGEATDHRFPGTVAGAIASAQRAAKLALEALGSG